MFSCGGNPPSRVYVSGKKHIPEQETVDWNPDGEYCLFIKRVNGTTFCFGNKERILIVAKESYDKLKVGDTLERKY